VRAALADNDIARSYLLATEFLDAEAFGDGIATVTRTTASFFMCHVLCPFCVPFPAALATVKNSELTCCDLPGRDAGDPYFGVILTVTHLAPVVLASLELDDTYLLGAAVLNDVSADRGCHRS